MKESANYWKIFYNGIIPANPIFVLLLGMCATLGTTSSAFNGLMMGIATAAVLICSNLFISLLRKFIPRQVRIAAYIVIISGFVTAVELSMKAFLPSLDRALGLFIPLIVVNCIILARAEAFASKNGPVASLVDGLAMGLGFTFALILIATVREILGAGTFCGISLFGESFKPAIILILPPGAFLTLGFIIAVVQKITNTRDDKRKLREHALEAETESAETEAEAQKEEVSA